MEEVFTKMSLFTNCELLFLEEICFDIYELLLNNMLILAYVIMVQYQKRTLKFLPRKLLS